ncbi:MAG: hypothetical protein RUMPE_00902 [Eubacteriales bacterium SKADARSKE-1]|nr:hypothetical protein [Eubacteriales bacterium SKADARSKE-1]
MNYKTISNLLLKKSNKYLKVSIPLFVFSLILLSIFSTLFLNQYIQVKKDFINNYNTHIIEAYYTNDQSSIHELKFSDENLIREKLKEQIPNLDYDIVKKYQINFSVEDENGRSFFLYALSKNAQDFSGINELENNSLYTDSLEGGYSTLNLPVILIKQGGFISNKTVEYKLKNCNENFSKSPFFSNENSEQAFVGFDTYKNIIEMMYGTKWDTFEKQFDESNTFGIQAINRMFIYVKDLNKVESVARVLDYMGFSTNYTFKAFDNFSLSIENTIFISMFLSIAIFLITAVYIILSFNSYLKVQQKDIGILKHYKYTEKMINRLYSKNINKTFINTGIFIALFIIIIGSVFLGIKQYLYIGLILSVVLALLCVVNRIIVLFLLRKYTNKNIIELLKKSKEFE